MINNSKHIIFIFCSFIEVVISQYNLSYNKNDFTNIIRSYKTFLIDDNDIYINEGYKNLESNINCFFLTSSFNVFNLNSLSNNSKEDNYFNVSNLQETTNKRVAYNFCKPAIKKCNGNNGQFILYKSSKLAKEECTIIAGDNIANNKWGIKETKNDDKTTRKDLFIALDSGQYCDINNTKKYQVELFIECDKEGKKGEIYLKSDSVYPDFNKLKDNCTHTFYLKSLHGCPLNNYYAVSAFVQKNKAVFTMIALIIGVFLCFFGNYMIKITISITAFLVTIAIVFNLIFNVINVNGSNISFALMWVILACTIILGILVGLSFFKYIKVFYGALGGFAGFVLGISTYTFALRYIKENPNVVFWLTVVVFVILGILAGIYLVEHLVIFCTSIIGAYISVRALSVLIGGYPSESEVIDLIQKKEYSTLHKIINEKVYIYLAIFVLLTLGGLYTQYIISKKSTDKANNQNIENLIE